MRRTSLLLIGTLFSTAIASEAKAEPMYLNVWQSPLSNYHPRIDVSNGFTGFSYMTGNPVYATGQFDTPFSFHITYGPQDIGAQTPYASLDLTGNLHWEISESDSNGRKGGSISGSGVLSYLRIFPTADSLEIPSWLPGLTVEISGIVTGGMQNLLETTVTITPHETPEPTSLAVFGVGLGVLAFRAVRRSRRSA
ncbi:PEP-CTERM protein-sorting domain-containing protein [Singulisphaera sp. GP187]|uniref:PEP-CTERM sorting domain-containing protein n=1 Tax=Singulisphaera sp. GP187 TaxID=1882752 RepID=UPI00092C10F1|nr:PEP-CTERM sorting domain-containing protein [Singulisphaera sp. GP187]SIO66142.1 PEP-CTERM protein-sorting domain-containing protein [Singulisphaera sp. GP187]